MNDLRLSPADAAARVLERLERSADPERALQVQRHFKETVHSFGVGSPAVRALAREMHEATREHWTIADAVSLCDCLFPRPELEAKAVPRTILSYAIECFPEKRGASSCCEPGQVKAESPRPAGRSYYLYPLLLMH